MFTVWPRINRVARVAALVTAAVAGLAACGTGSSSSASPASSAAGDQVVTIGTNARSASPTQITVPVVASIRAELPAAIRYRGTLVVGIGALPAGFPPLAYVGTDQQTLTGSEPDLGRLVAAVFGLRADVQNASWENMFVRIKSGQFDAGFSNITDTELRKQQGLDFASYRQDNLGFEVKKSSSWRWNGDYESLAGKTVAVGSGTNQEKILLAWQAKLKSEGKSLDVRYFSDDNGTYLALDSGRIDAFFQPNPAIAYHAAQDADTPNATVDAGTYSGAGASLQGLIAATTRRGDGLAKPLADAINYLIQHGQYAKWLATYHLSNEAVATSTVNPPGLPLSDS
jgi:polar amino acid transport system substrate-binding protein